MIADKFNMKDIEKYYRGTFIVCPEYDPKKLLYVRNVMHNGIEVSFTTPDGTEEMGFIDVLESSYRINSPLPVRRQWFQLNGIYAGYIARLPARMWKKGLHKENTLVYHVGEKGHFQQLAIHAEILSNLLIPSYPEKISFQADEPMSVALSPIWGWCRKSNDVFLHDKIVGRTSARGAKLILLKEFKDLPIPKALQELKVSYV